MPAAVANIYLDGTYANQNDRFGDEDAVWKAGNVRRMIGKLGLEPKSICDVGCGGGGVLLALKDAMPADVRFTGYEPMPEAFAVCQQRTCPGMEFFNGPPPAAPPAGPYDLVLCSDVFEHVEDYMGFLRGLRDLGRMFIFHIPLDMSVQTVLRMEPLLRVRRTVGHLHYFSKDTALATLADTGYEVKQWFYTDGSKGAYTSFKHTLMKFPRKALSAIAPNFAARLLGGFPLMAAAVPRDRTS